MEGNNTVNYEDERFAQVETDKQAALQEVENTYSGMINDSDDYYQAQIDASKEWADKQTQLQQEQTDFAIEQIEQEKEQAQKDYTKEQSGAYVDWQKQSDQHGVRAEQIADMGMQNTGYSESSQVSMYNTYQNRVATARESFNKAILNYNNAITQARMQNNAALAEIAANALQQQLTLSLEGMQYKNQLLLQLADKKTQTETLYYQRYQDVLNQINQENALAEQIRQFNIKNGIGSGSGSGSGSGGGYGGGYTGVWDIDKDADDVTETETTETESDEPKVTVNEKSVMELGFGPVTGDQLADMEKAGVITSYRNGNSIYFERTDKAAGLGGSYYNNQRVTTPVTTKKAEEPGFLKQAAGNLLDFLEEAGPLFWLK